MSVEHLLEDEPFGQVAHKPALDQQMPGIAYVASCVRTRKNQHPLGITWHAQRSL